MKKKKILILSALIMLILSLCSCSSNNKSVDESFVEAFKQGMINRWKVVERNQADDEDSQTTKEWEDAINAELKQIQEFKDKTFENTELEKVAKEYIEVLEKSLEYTKYVDSDYSKFVDEYTPLYNQRLKLLYQLNSICQITFDEKYQDEWEDILEEGEMCNFVINLTDTIQFEKQDGQYYTTYSTVVENTTSQDIEYFRIDINLLDAQGVVINSAYVQPINNWEPGQKVKLSFNVNEPFEHYEVSNYVCSEMN